MNAIVNPVTSSFPVRRMDFKFEQTPRYWMGDDPCSTHIMDGTSVLFPAGEAFFVKSVRAVRDLITDPQLQKDISAFIGQEAMHSKEHHAFHTNANAHGLNIESFEQTTDRIITFLTAILAKIIDEKQGNLAITCALEHFTATYASHFMQRHETLAKLITDTRMYKLWMWHATEEAEHKAVAYDVYEAIYGKGTAAYATRSAIMAAAMPIFFIVQLTFTARLMSRDKNLFNVKSWAKGVSYFWGKKGIFTEMLPEMFDYFRRDFHPNDHDTDSLLAQTQARLGIIH